MKRLLTVQSVEHKFKDCYDLTGSDECVRDLSTKQIMEFPDWEVLLLQSEDDTSPVRLEVVGVCVSETPKKLGMIGTMMNLMRWMWSSKKPLGDRTIIVSVSRGDASLRTGCLLFKEDD